MTVTSLLCFPSFDLYAAEDVQSDQHLVAGKLRVKYWMSPSLQERVMTGVTFETLENIEYRDQLEIIYG